MPRSNIYRNLFACVIFTISCQASAQLVLNVNTTTKELHFTGSDTGNPHNVVGPVGLARWGDGGTITADTITLTGTATYVTSSQGYQSDASLYATNTGGIDIHFTTSGGASDTTLTGTSATYSYAGASAGFISALESSIGSTLTLHTGSSYNTISVVAAAVPEPGSFAAIMGGLFLTFGLTRRRSRRVTNG